MMQGNERRYKANGMVEVDDTPERLERRQEGRMVKRLEQRFGRLMRVSGQRERKDSGGRSGWGKRKVDGMTRKYQKKDDRTGGAARRKSAGPPRGRGVEEGPREGGRLTDERWRQQWCTWEQSAACERVGSVPAVVQVLPSAHRDGGGPRCRRRHMP